MVKKITLFVFGIILMSSYSVFAMHCHNTSHDNHGTSHDSHNTSMTDNMDEVMGEDEDHGHVSGSHDSGDEHHMDQSRTGTHSMDENAMRNAIGKYMSEKGITAYHIGSIKDGNTHYRANVHRHNGDLLDKLIINKKTGTIHSILVE